MILAGVDDTSTRSRSQDLRIMGLVCCTQLIVAIFVHKQIINLTIIPHMRITKLLKML